MLRGQMPALLFTNRIPVGMDASVAIETTETARSIPLIYFYVEVFVIVDKV